MKVLRSCSVLGSFDKNATICSFPLLHDDNDGEGKVAKNKREKNASFSRLVPEQVVPLLLINSLQIPRLRDVSRHLLKVADSRH